MGDRSGSAAGRFRRAIEHGSLFNAEAAARELGRLELADALDLLLLIAQKEPHRFERAAVRWHGRFELEVRGVHVADAQMLLGALAGLREPVPRTSLETIRRCLAFHAGRFQPHLIDGAIDDARALKACADRIGRSGWN